MNNGFYSFPNGNSIGAKSASYAITASYALTGGSGGGGNFAATSSYVNLGLDANIGSQSLGLDENNYPVLRGYRLSISGAASTTITGNSVSVGINGGNTYLYGIVSLPIATYNITASQASTASYALTASFVPNIATSSIIETYSIPCNMGGTTVSAGGTFYMGQGGYSANNTANRRNVYIPFTGTLVAATITTGTTSTTVTASDVAVAFRLNNITDTSLGNVRFTGGNANANGTVLSYYIPGLNTAVTAGDFFEIKFTFPSPFASLPAAASLTVVLYFTRTA